jgi:hypothetical protein
MSGMSGDLILNAEATSKQFIQARKNRAQSNLAVIP